MASIWLCRDSTDGKRAVPGVEGRGTGEWGLEGEGVEGVGREHFQQRERSAMGEPNEGTTGGVFERARGRGGGVVGELGTGLMGVKMQGRGIWWYGAYDDRGAKGAWMIRQEVPTILCPLPTVQCPLSSQ